ncbi:MAG: fasciclin domain-containing protein [Chitinophagaceae bacterium]
MQKIITICFAVLILIGCQSNQENGSSPSAVTTSAADGGQSTVEDNESQKDVVKIAVGSKDHTTLVAALKAAEYVDVLSNAGPFTVFAPTNDAFNKLPPGTVEGLLKAEKKADLRNILEYHVFVGVLKPEMLQDGQSYGQANGDNIKIAVTNGKISVNGANIIASVPASNGIIHVVDAVLLPPAK